MTTSKEDLDITVHMYMGSPVFTIGPDESLEAARQSLEGHRVSSLGVVDDDNVLLGVITRTDLLRVGRSHAQRVVRRTSLELPEHTVREAMTTEVIRIKGTASVRDAAREMVKGTVHRVFVDDGGAVDGVISTRDVMDAIADLRIETPLEDIMTSPAETIASKAGACDALDRMDEMGYSGLVVVDRGWPVGIFTQVEALIARDLPSDIGVEWAMNPAMLVLPHNTPLFRAAFQAASMDVRQVVVTKGHLVAGVATGLDFCKAII